MTSLDRIARNSRAGRDARAPGEEREQEWHRPPGGDMVFYVVITVVAVILCGILGALLRAP